jgi:hypothetical protein
MLLPLPIGEQKHKQLRIPTPMQLLLPGHSPGLLPCFRHSHPPGLLSPDRATITILPDQAVFQ